MSEVDHGAPSDARQTLLRAMDNLDEIEKDHGEARRVYLCAVYAHQAEGETIRGWASTDDPSFITVALLREVADAIENGLGWDPRGEDDRSEPDD